METNQRYVVIDRTQARFFTSESKASSAVFVKRLQNPLGREKNRAFNTDKPGSERTRIGKSVVGHSMTGEKDHHEDVAIRFLRSIARAIVSDLQTHHFKRLVIYADPHLSGLVHEILGRRHLTVPIVFRQKNFSKLSDYEVAGIIRTDNREERSEHENRT